MENTKSQVSSILEMARGAILEQVNVEVGRIVENILDPNTEAKKKRTLTLTVDFTPSADRTTIVVSANAKSKLLANNAIQTSLYVGADARTGEVMATELVPNIPGQMSFDGENEEEPKSIKISACGGI